MLLFDVESEIILKVAIRKLESNEENSASSFLKALVWRNKKKKHINKEILV